MIEQTVFWVKPSNEEKSYIINEMFKNMLHKGTSVDPTDYLDEVMAMAFTFWKD